MPRVGNVRVFGLCEGDTKDDVHHDDCKAQGQAQPQSRYPNVDPWILWAILHRQHDAHSQHFKRGADLDQLVKSCCELCMQSCTANDWLPWHDGHLRRLCCPRGLLHSLQSRRSSMCLLLEWCKVHKYSASCALIA